MATKNIQSADKAFYSEAIVKGAFVYLNKDTVWSREVINYLSTDYDGNAELTLEGMYNATFKLRKNGRYSCAKGTVYADTDPMAKVLYDAYVAAQTAVRNAEKAEQAKKDARQRLNWKRQEMVEALNDPDDRGSSGSPDTYVRTTVVAVNSLKWSDTSEFTPNAAVVVKHNSGPNSGMTSVMTLTVEAAEELCQQLADAVIKARTDMLPALSKLADKWAKQDADDPFYTKMLENERARAEWEQERRERLLK